MPMRGVQCQLLGDSLGNRKMRKEPKTIETILGAVTENGVVIQDMIGVRAAWLPSS